MINSKYQNDFYGEVKTTSNNLLLRAGAGSGKTTSLVAALNLLPKYQKTIALAFNKSIALEMKDRMPTHVTSQTLHSLGFSIIGKCKRSYLKVTEWKEFALLKDIVKDYDIPENTENKFKFTVRDIVSYVRITMSRRDIDSIRAVAVKYGIMAQSDELEASIKLLSAMDDYNKKNHKEFMVSYDDMICIPIEQNMPIPKYHNIAVDEAQDLNAIQHEFILRLKDRIGRYIFVGDENQAIYGFAGASTDSFNMIREKFNAKEMPLSICYRCGTDIVAHAQLINDEIEPFEDNEAGLVILNSSIDEIELNDIVVCRNLRPLIFLYFELLKMEIQCHIVGEDMLSGIKTMIDGLGDVGKKEALFKLEQEEQYIFQTLLDEGVEKPHKDRRFFQFKEKKSIIVLFLERYDYISEAKEVLNSLFEEKRGGVKLMTGHKSKGLEADRVFYISHFDQKRLIPSDFAETIEEKQQELNLEYVIRTRAKKELHYIRL